MPLRRPTAPSNDALARLYAKTFLNTSDEEIRVLDLLPSLFPREVKVKIRVVKLSSEPIYEALSYTWGESSDDRTILVNGKFKIPVTDNLHNALKRLRSPLSVRTVWADQLCINQSNTKERSEQVALMGEIYRKAACVNVWLGEPGWTFPINFEVVPSLFHGSWRMLLLQSNTSAWRAWFDAFCNTVERIENAIKHTQPCWHERAWVAQEFILGNKIFLWCGGKRSEYNNEWLLDLYSYSAASSSKGLNSNAFFQKVQSEFGPLRNEWGRKNDVDRYMTDIFDCRSKIRSCEATNPKDKVYCFLGLLEQDEAALIGSDYTRSCSELYAQATYASIKTRKDFDILQWLVNEPTTPGLPTWCVDFDLKTPPFWNIPVASILRRPRTDPQDEDVANLGLDGSKRHLSVSATTMGPVVRTVNCAREKVLVQTWLDDLYDLIQDAASRARQTREDCRTTGASTILDLFIPLGLNTGNEHAFLRKTFVERVLTQLSNSYRSDENQLYEENYSYVARQAFSLWRGLTGLEGIWKAKTVSNFPKQALEVAIERAMFYASSGITIFTMPSGLVGIGPANIAPGDIVVQVCSGAPFLALRTDGTLHTFQGHVFLHDLWRNGLFEAIHGLGMEQTKFVLR